MGTRPVLPPESILTNGRAERGRSGRSAGNCSPSQQADRDSGFVATSTGMKTLSIWVCNAQWGVALQKLKQW